VRKGVGAGDAAQRDILQSTVSTGYERFDIRSNVELARAIGAKRKHEAILCDIVTLLEDMIPLVFEN